VQTLFVNKEDSNLFKSNREFFFLVKIWVGFEFRVPEVTLGFLMWVAYLGQPFRHLDSAWSCLAVQSAITMKC
jgi:hypothetical protein